MKRPIYIFTKQFAVALLCAFALTPAAFPHAGHDKAPGEEGEADTKGPIAISAEAKKNLGLTVEEAEVRTLEKTLLVLGHIEAIPNRSAAVSSRISGRVTEIKVNEGEKIKKGQQVVEVESRQLGDPPPRVKYAAPMDGIVTDRHVVLGDTVEPDKHLIEIVDLSEVYAEGLIAEGEISHVKIGQAVRITVEAFPKETFTGKVELFSGTLDAETRSLKFWVRVKNPDGKLRPNMRAQLHIVTEQADSVIAVSNSAVLGESGNLFVFVQSDTDELVYERRPIVVGLKDDRYTEVSEGVFPGDKVVTSGNYQLQYVTTRKAAPKVQGTNAPGTNAVTAAAHTEEKEEASASHGHEKNKILLWVGIGVGALLLLNAIILIVRKPCAPERQSVPTAVSEKQ